MKHFFGLLVLIGLWSGDSKRVTDTGVASVVQRSLRTGSARQLAAYFDTTIELIIDTEAVEFQSVEAAHAELILKSFFRRHPPQRFQYVYQGMSDHQYYSSGNYQSGGQRFQVYVLMREKKGQDTHSGVNQPQQYVINTLHFRKVD